MSKELIERLSKHRPGKGDLDDEAADRIKQLLRRIEYLELCCDEGERQLAASQAREQQLREALVACVCAMQDYQAGIGITELFDKGERLGRLVLLSEKQDTTAFEAMIQKAGEVMRERAAKGAEKEAVQIVVDGREERAYNNAVADCANAIRALPGVTLEDLK